MPDIRLTCTNCHATVKSATTVPAGKRVRCPKCKELFTVADDDAPADGIQEEPAPRSSKANPRFDALDDDQPTIQKKESNKSNLVLILGLIGCGGLLLLGCLIGIPAALMATFLQPMPMEAAVAPAMAQAVDAEVMPAKQKAADDGMKPAAPNKFKNDFDQIPMGDHIDKIEARMGGRGTIGAAGIPKLTDQALGVTIAKNMTAFKVNVIRSWTDAVTGDTLVIGLQEDVVGFKGYYTQVGAETRVVHQFTTKKK